MASRKAKKPIRRSGTADLAQLARGLHGDTERLPQPPAETGLPVKPAAVLPVGYGELLEDLKARIRTAQVRASLSANAELIRLYWDIGRQIVQRQEREGWGAGIIERLAADLQAEFPGIGGFSKVNIWRMRAFYLAYSHDVTILSQPARESAGSELSQAARDTAGDGPPEHLTGIPWFHNVTIVEKLKDPFQRLWYARMALEHGWSRSILVMQIEADLYGREGQAQTNFRRTLPPPQSDLAQQALKDPYIFDFLTLSDDAAERRIHDGLADHLRQFILELGAGFAFVGSRHHLAVGGQDYYLDLLFYHLRLRCFVVIDLKVKAFEPEFAGKMGFYLSAVDDLLRHPDDRATIGLILCKERNRIIVEYALRESTRPMGVATYTLTRALPSELAANLPSVEQLEAELRGHGGEP